jgi:hypothetical protein
MRKVVYTSPSGQTILNPSDAEVQAIVDNTPQEYWTRGSGEARFRFSNGRDAFLALTIKEPFGVRLLYTSGNERLHVPYQIDDRTELTSVFVGGEYLNEPVNYFLSKQTAKQILAHFCETGEKVGIVTWRPWGEGNWRPDDQIYGDPY